jgi:high affinity sulfate transporter 1
MRHYERSWLGGDLIAGLSVWALMVPASMAYATISGVPSHYGLYAAAAGLIGFALFTTSREVTQGPSSSSAAVVGAAVLGLATAGSDQAIAIVASISLVAALIYVAMFLLKMGWVSHFLSASVLIGFQFGVAIDIVSTELFELTGSTPSGASTWERIFEWSSSLQQTNRATVYVGIATLVLLFGAKRFAPRVPAAFVAVVLGVSATWIFGLADFGVALIDPVPTGMPEVAWPNLHLIRENGSQIFQAALGLVIIGFSVTTAAVRKYADKHHYRVDINQELLAQGVSNACSGLVQGFFINASLSKSPINDESGAKTQLSNLAQAAFIILTLLFLSPLFKDLPQAVLAAIIIEAVVTGMMDVTGMARLYRVKRSEFLAALGALLGVLSFGVLDGLSIGVGISLVSLVAESARPRIPELGRKPGMDDFVELAQYPDSQPVPGLRILRFDGGLFFANVGALIDRLREIRVDSGPQLEGIILSLEGVDFIDAEGADALRAIARAAASLGVDLHFVRVKSQVLDVLMRDGLEDIVATGHLHDSIALAVEAHLRRHPPGST